MHWVGLKGAWWTDGWGRICMHSFEWKARYRRVSCHFGRGLIAIFLDTGFGPSLDRLPTKASGTSLGLFWLNRQVGPVGVLPFYSFLILQLQCDLGLCWCHMMPHERTLDVLFLLCIVCCQVCEWRYLLKLNWLETLVPLYGSGIPLRLFCPHISELRPSCLDDLSTRFEKWVSMQCALHM